MPQMKWSPLPACPPACLRCRQAGPAGGLHRPDHLLENVLRRPALLLGCSDLLGSEHRLNHLRCAAHSRARPPVVA